MTDCFIPYQSEEIITSLIEELRSFHEVKNIYVLCRKEDNYSSSYPSIIIDELNSSCTIKKIAENSQSEFSLFIIKPCKIKFGLHALQRMETIAEDCSAGLLYADYHIQKEQLENKPLIDYQIGSIRDDFDFGPVLFFKTSILKENINTKTAAYKYAGIYDIRLKISQSSVIFHLNEYLYTEFENHSQSEADKQFGYVDPRNRENQLEKELVCTEHLKRINAYLAPNFKEISFDEEIFEYEASVIIPVRNRVRTIEEAIKSVLIQKTKFKYNLIVIDNHSTDGTGDAIEKLAKKDNRIIHIIPQREDLGIGGCWNIGIDHPKCGKFAIQLDSDDVYKDENTIQKVVDAFYAQNCAMVIGSYMITDFSMKMIPPGIIDHKEWTPDNGRNNALRINGLGAPRAFYTPLLRKIHFPNTSYGEDYALGLRISHDYQIGRIYDILYLCRRWEDNSDASISIEKLNCYNLYKDKLRSIEIQKRQKEKI